MNKSSDARDPSIFDRVEQVAKSLSIIAIPIVLGVGGWIIQSAVSEQSVNKDYVQLAVSILTESEDPSLRGWAVKLLNDKSSVKFDGEVAQQLLAGEIRLPGRIFTPSSLDQTFVDDLFSAWNADTKVSRDSKVILAAFAKALLEKRWLEVTRYFDPKYAWDQLTLLGGGPNGDRGTEGTIQFIQEALIVYDKPYASIFEIEMQRVTKIRFLDIVDSDWGEEYADVHFRMIQDDGKSLDTGYTFQRGNLFFVGASG